MRLQLARRRQSPATDSSRSPTAGATSAIVTASVTIALEDLFSTVGATTTIPLPPRTSIRFSGAPPQLRHGLQNVAGTLAQGNLERNTRITLALDLEKFGGLHAAFRFTRLDVAPAGGEIWVERLASVGVEGLRAPERQGSLSRFTRLGLVRGGGFTDEQFDAVLIGLAELPYTVLAPLRGLRFQRQERALTSAL